MIHSMKLHTKYFNKIKAGEKKIEVRLFDDKRKKISVGDIIQFQDASDSRRIVNTEVVGLLHYNNFQV